MVGVVRPGTGQSGRKRWISPRSGAGHFASSIFQGGMRSVSDPHVQERSTLAGTLLCHGVPTNGSRSSLAVSSFGAMPVTSSPARPG